MAEDLLPNRLLKERLEPSTLQYIGILNSDTRQGWERTERRVRTALL